MNKEAMRGLNMIDKIIYAIKIEIIDALDWISFLILCLITQTLWSSFTAKEFDSTPFNRFT
jgi:hypothetical protein